MEEGACGQVPAPNFPAQFITHESVNPEAIVGFVEENDEQGTENEDSG